MVNESQKQNNVANPRHIVPRAIEGVLKARSPSAIGITKKELKWGLGDVITEASISCAYSGGKINQGNYLLVCFDCSSAVADVLLGSGVTPYESLSSDISVYQVFPGESISPEFSEALSYAGNAGFLGNAWVRSVDATNTLDAIIYGVDKS